VFLSDILEHAGPVVAKKVSIAGNAVKAGNNANSYEQVQIAILINIFNGYR
jgi:hypothetical protein